MAGRYHGGTAVSWYAVIEGLSIGMSPRPTVVRKLRTRKRHTSIASAARLAKMMAHSKFVPVRVFVFETKAYEEVWL